MELIDKTSEMIMTEKLNLFTSAPTLTPVVEWLKVTPIYPIGNIKDSEIIEFYIPGSSTDFIDLERMKIVTQAHAYSIGASNVIVDIADTDKDLVSISPNPLFGQFSNVEVSLNEKVIEHSNNLYHLQTHCQNLISTDQATLDTELQLEGVHWQTPGEGDKKTHANNAAILKRYNQFFTKGSKRIKLIAPLKIAICQQGRLLIPGVSIRIKFMKNDLKHILLCEADKYGYKIEKVSIHVPRVRLNAPASLAIESTLRKTPAVYQFERIRNTYLTIPSGTASGVYEGIYSGKLHFQNIMK